MEEEDGNRGISQPRAFYELFMYQTRMQVHKTIAIISLGIVRKALKVIYSERNKLALLQSLAKNTYPIPSNVCMGYHSFTFFSINMRDRVGPIIGDGDRRWIMFESNSTNCSVVSWGDIPKLPFPVAAIIRYYYEKRPYRVIDILVYSL